MAQYKTPLDAMGAMCSIRDDRVLVFAMGLCAYMDVDGEMGYRHFVTGEVDIIQALGAMECWKSDYLHKGIEKD